MKNERTKRTRRPRPLPNDVIITAVNTGAGETTIISPLGSTTTVEVGERDENARAKLEAAALELSRGDGDDCQQQVRPL